MSSTPYDRQTSFALYSAENPGEPHSGATLDAEFNAVKIAFDDTQQNLALIQDDDGALKRGSVGQAQFDASVSIGFGAPSQWASGQIYTADVNTVFYQSKFYIANTTHTSGVSFEADKWDEIADFTLAAVIADGSITSAKLAAGAVTADKIGDGSVSNTKLATGAVSTNKIADSNVTTSKIADSNVTTSKIADSNVTTPKVADDAITFAKMQNVTGSRLLGNPTGGAADPSEISLAGGLEFSGTSVRGFSVVPTIQRFTSGSGTYTTPAGCKWIRIRMAGGGAGGGGGNNSSGSTAGGSSTFSGGSLVAAGGSSAAVAAGGAGGAATNGNVVNISGGSGQGANGSTNGSGGCGGNSAFGGGGGGGVAATGVGQAAATNTGGGGGGGAFSTSSAAGGGAGAYVEHIISSPASSYTYAVGAGGAGAAGSGGGGNGGAGGSGVIIVEEHY